MRYEYIQRNLQDELLDCLNTFPVVAVLGPRQCGKSTLAHAIIDGIENSIYLDLEKPSDLQKISEPELFFDLHKDRLICLDEIQRMPELFPVLRSVIDERKRKGQFLILGSASPNLIRQSSETLAGRIAYFELTPFLFSEIAAKIQDLNSYFLRGGFPESALARSDIDSLRWRRNFIRTFLERDIPQFGIQIPARTIERLWKMCAHHHGQLLNQSRLGESMGVSHTTIRSYIDLLSQTFMLRVLLPLETTLKKRLIKSPRIYVRDSGVLHALLDIETYDELMSHPVFGASWEGMVIENILGEFPYWKGSFYRTAAGAELDLVLEKGQKRLAVECKASAAPEVAKGFWNALQDLEIDEAWIIAPIKESYPLKKGVTVVSLVDFLDRKRKNTANNEDG